MIFQINNFLQIGKRTKAFESAKDDYFALKKLSVAEILRIVKATGWQLNERQAIHILKNALIVLEKVKNRTKSVTEENILVLDHWQIEIVEFKYDTGNFTVAESVCMIGEIIGALCKIDSTWLKSQIDQMCSTEASDRPEPQ